VSGFILSISHASMWRLCGLHSTITLRPAACHGSTRCMLWLDNRWQPERYTLHAACSPPLRPAE
jgi:hypothetical protein